MGIKVVYFFLKYRSMFGFYFRFVFFVFFIFWLFLERNVFSVKYVLINNLFYLFFFSRFDRDIKDFEIDLVFILKIRLFVIDGWWGVRLSRGV